MGGPVLLQLCVKSGLAPSGKEAKRTIASGGAKMDDVVVTDAGTMVSAEAISKTVKLSAGKKRHALIKLAD